MPPFCHPAEQSVKAKTFLQFPRFRMPPALMMSACGQTASASPSCRFDMPMNSDRRADSDIRSKKLKTEIALILIIKITAIFCLWHAFFSPSHRPEVNPDRMSEAVFPVKDAARP